MRLVGSWLVAANLKAVRQYDGTQATDQDQDGLPADSHL